MSKKTNSLSLRSIKNKNWDSISFFEDYNYSQVLHQDLHVQNYAENFLRHNFGDSGGLIHNINIQRKNFSIYVFLDYYFLEDIYSKKNRRSSSQGDNNLSFKRQKRKHFHRKFFAIRNNFKSYAFRLKILPFYKRRPKVKENPYQKYFLRKLPYRGRQEKKYCKINLGNLSLSKKIYFPLFSLKRILLINLILLTDCRVRIYSRNIAELAKFPLFIKDKKAQEEEDIRILKKNIRGTKDYTKVQLDKEITSIKNSIRSVADLKRIYNMRNVPMRIKNLDIFKMIHLFYTSITFKNPDLLGSFLGIVLKRNIKVFNIFFYYISYVLSVIFNISSLSGLKIQFKGRLGSSLRKKVSIINFGSMPLQKLDANIKYSFREIYTIYGICGIKIWYYY